MTLYSTANVTYCLLARWQRRLVPHIRHLKYEGVWSQKSCLHDYMPASLPPVALPLPRCLPCTHIRTLSRDLSKKMSCQTISNVYNKRTRPHSHTCRAALIVMAIECQPTPALAGIWTAHLIDVMAVNRALITPCA